MKESTQDTTHLYGVASQNDDIHTSYRSSIAVQGGDRKQEWPWVPVKPQLGIPTRGSAAIGTNLNTYTHTLSDGPGFCGGWVYW